MGKYKGLDIFRIFATLLIITIHTSPLESYSVTANFILTGIMSRVAVPFFFMVTGFFIVPKLYTEQGRLTTIKFIKKIGIIYLISLLIYLPVTIYTTNISEFSILVLLRGILFYGNVYHLWYLPATIIGLIIIYFLSRKMNITKVLIITAVLYVIGVLGDSYYGIIKNVDSLRGIYNFMFLLFINTRNGLFFAPLFLAMGGIINKYPNKYSFRKYSIGFIISLSLFIVEGILVKPYLLTQQDNMYMLLAPCMYYLYRLLLFWKGNSYKILRKLCLLVYIIHPIYVFLFRKVIANSLVLFLLVTSISFISCTIFLKLFKNTKLFN